MYETIHEFIFWGNFEEARISS